MIAKPFIDAACPGQRKYALPTPVAQYAGCAVCGLVRLRARQEAAA